MSNELYHHGIKGMKWGVRRTPKQLGYAVAKKVPSGEKKAPKVTATKTQGKALRKFTSISDDELKKRIDRLDMEERYEVLVSKQNARSNARSNTGFKATAKKLLAGSAEDLGKQLLGKAVSKLVERIAGEKKFDIDDYKEVDVNKIDANAISKVLTWYEAATKINSRRRILASASSDSTPASEPKPPDSSGQ